MIGYPTREREREMFNLTTHSTHFIYGYMASDIWLRTILIVRKETRCRHMGYSYRLTARVLLYAPSHRQDNTYHGLCYTSRGALAGTRNSSMGPPHEGSIRRPITPWANALPLSYVPQIQDTHSILYPTNTEDTHSILYPTFYLQLYGITHMVKDQSDSEREETCCCHMGYSFWLAARVLLYASLTDRIAHTKALIWLLTTTTGCCSD